MAWVDLSNNDNKYGWHLVPKDEAEAEHKNIPTSLQGRKGQLAPGEEARRPHCLMFLQAALWGCGEAGSHSQMMRGKPHSRNNVTAEKWGLPARSSSLVVDNKIALLLQLSPPPPLLLLFALLTYLSVSCTCDCYYGFHPILVRTNDHNRSEQQKKWSAKWWVEVLSWRCLLVSYYLA